MGERLSAFWNTVKEIWTKATKKMRILVLGGIAAVLLLALVIVMWLNHTDYIVLYNNLTVEENAGILAQLQEMGVQGKLDGNSILIPAEAESDVRMQLAMKSAPSSGGRYDTFALGGGLTSTQFDKDFYSNAQLEEDLEKSIKTFPEVQDVQVTISTPDNNIFVLQDEIQKPSVAVKIQKMPGRSLTTEQVRGILNLVRTSVPGVEEDNIAIVDETGDMRMYLDLVGDKSSVKLQLTEMVNKTLESRILGMLTPVYGEGRVVVKANSVLDTDEVSTTKTTYIPLDPENPQNNPVDYYEREGERTGTGPIVEGVPGANDNTDVPTYAAEEVDDGSGDYYRSHVIYDYLVSSEVQEIERAGLVITDATIAVLIDSYELPDQRLPDADRDKIFDIVATASGLISDKVSVQSMAFIQSELPAITVTDTLPWGLIIAVSALLIAAIVIIIIVLTGRAKKKAAAEGAYMDDDASLMDLLAEREEEFEPIQLAETQEQKLKAQIRDLANSDPEIVAQLIKTWLINA